MKKQIQAYYIDQIATGAKLRSWNSEWKIITCFILLWFCIWTSNLAVSIWLIGSAAIINIKSTRMAAFQYGKVLAIPLFFISMSSAAIALLIGKEGGWHLYVTTDSLSLGLLVAVRSMGAVSVLYLLIFSTPVYELVRVMQRAHVPQIVTELMILMYRYIFILLVVWLDYVKGASSRMGYCDFPTSCRTFGQMLGNLLVRSLKKSGAYYDAMVSRGYDGQINFWEEPSKITKRQVVSTLLYIGSTVGVYFGSK